MWLCTGYTLQLQDQIAPLREKLRKKEGEKQRMRSLGKDEEERLSTTCNSFLADVTNLRELSEQIDTYIGSSKEDELDGITNEAKSIVAQMNQVRAEIETMQPELDKLSKAVEDQERHKKNIKDNIDIIQSCQQIEALGKQIVKLEANVANVEGHKTCNNEFAALVGARQELVSSKARLEGRRGEILESIRGFKVGQEQFPYSISSTIVFCAHICSVLRCAMTEEVVNPRIQERRRRTSCRNDKVRDDANASTRY